MTEVIKITLENNEVWHIKLDRLAHKLAKIKHPDTGEDFRAEKFFYKDCPEEAAADLPNMLGWGDVHKIGYPVEPPDSPDYDQMFQHAEFDAVEVHL